MRLAVLALVALTLGSCTQTTAAQNPAENFWTPGLIGVPGESATGFGPAGYPGVRDDSIDFEPVQQFLASVSLQSSDLTTGESLLLAPKGNLISQPSLSLCDGDFDSEYARLVRRKIEIVDAANDPTGILSEAIQYESAEAASGAIAELSEVVAECGASGEYVSGVSVIKFDYLRAGITGLGEASLPNGAFSLEYAIEQAVTAQVWQQRGNTLVLIQVTSSSPIDYRRLQTLAQSINTRLLAADPLDIGEFD